MNTEDVYKDLKEHFENDGRVVVNSGKGAQGIKVGKKMIIMFYKGDITVYFSPEKTRELIESGAALPHDPGTGKPMKDRVLVTADKKETWISLCEESVQAFTNN